jgi:hypothetical protein
VNNHRLHRLKPQIRQIILLVTSYLLLVTLIGCDAFVRKFTRKPKKEDLPQQEMVLAPEEYKGARMSKEELYHQYFLFWKSWHDELIESLLQKKSIKKQIDCSQEMLGNLINLRPLLNIDMQKKLDIYIAQLKELQDQISKDTYGDSAVTNAQRLERIKRDILRDFSYNKISKDIS